jgi:hypothetical protein
MTPFRISIAATAIAVVLLLVVFELIRSRRLRERYALLWLVTGLVLVALSAWRGGLNTIASWLGVRSYPPAVLFAVGLYFGLLFLTRRELMLTLASEYWPWIRRRVLRRGTAPTAEQEPLLQTGEPRMTTQ